MRIYQTMEEAVKETEREVMEMGMRTTTKSYQDKWALDGFPTRELLGYSFLVESGEDWTKSFSALGMTDSADCERYVHQELEDRMKKGLASRNPGYSWIRRKDVWNKFKEKDGRFSYTYGERINETFGLNQGEDVKETWNYDHHSRQLIIQVYNQYLDGARRTGKRRVPCTMHYQILDRGEHLTLIHVMRSCDLYTHFAIDLSLSWLMAKHYAAMMGAKWPRVLMQIGSLHAFETDLVARGVF